MTLYSPLIGRLGNALFQWSYAKKRAEQLGATLYTPTWVGEKIFDIESPPPMDKEPDIKLEENYRQSQDDLIYSRRWLLNTLRIRPEIAEKLDAIIPRGEILCHLRRGDYGALGYQLVSRASYFKAAEHFGFDPEQLQFVTEEEPFTHPDFSGELSFLPDFYRLMRASIIFRGNSTFSWWSAALGSGRVFSPIVAGLPGGVISDCQFVPGNWPKFCDLVGISDLHLRDE